MHASNFSLHLVGNEQMHLKHALEIVCDDHKIKAWREVGEWMILYWHDKPKFPVNSLPAKFGAEEIFPIVAMWLREQKLSYAPDDIDGSVHQSGFELRSGFITDLEPPWDSYESCRIRKEYDYYHK